MLDINLISLVAYDFDGVLTDNKVRIDKYGEISVDVNRSDGQAISILKKNNVRQVIVTSEHRGFANKRAEKLGIDCLNCHNIPKLQVVRQYCSENKISLEMLLFVGNDINDIELLQASKYSFCPLDAHPLAKQTAQFVLEKKGGEGIVAELLYGFFDLPSLLRRC